MSSLPYTPTHELDELPEPHRAEVLAALTVLTSEPDKAGKSGEGGVSMMTNAEFVAAVFPQVLEGAFTKNWGATPQDWATFDLILGLAEDLLPVVSNPNSRISPQSKMQTLGKTPSQYNSARQVGGLPAWTQYRSSDADIRRWSREPDYGICLQTRTVRAIDADITDAALARSVHEEIDSFLGQVLPCRSRGNAAKFLLAFNLPGEYRKRTLKTTHGIIEFLADGQQFIACGTHPSGARYEWAGGFPAAFPTLTPDQFERLWKALEDKFGVEPSVTATASKAQRLELSRSTDPVLQKLISLGLVLSTERDGRVHITCPFEAEHTSESSESATTYWPAHTGGYPTPSIKCLHAHCAHRHTSDFLAAIGVSSGADDFEALDITPGVAEVPTKDTNPRFHVQPCELFSNGPPPEYLIKDVLPMAGLAVIFGEPGSGKSFLALDMAAAVARGVPWHGKKVKQGRVVYICAEGAGGFRKRVKAYIQQNQLKELEVGVIADAPNFMKLLDVTDVIKAVREYGDVVMIVVDTWSQVLPGANENSGEDMGLALAHCRALHKATGAVVVLVHHCGKDASKGARGWSGLRAAADAEVTVTRFENERVASISKMKDGDDGLAFGFKLLTVMVGIDEEGEDVTSCVVTYTVAVPKAQRNAKAPKGVLEKTVLTALSDLCPMEGGVSMVNLIDEAIKHVPFDTGSGKQDQRRKSLQRAINSLINRGAIKSNGNEISTLQHVKNYK